MKNVMITGAGGAIGAHVVQYLLEKTDWKLILVDSFLVEHKGYFDRLTEVTKKMRSEQFLSPRLQTIPHDLRTPFSKREVETIGKVDYIINLASRSDVQNAIDDPIDFVKNNTDLMLTMLEYAREAKPEVFLQFSTDEVYGPAPRDSGGHKEWDAIVPSNPYSASKAAQEALAIAWWRCYAVPVIITNTMNNFGEMQAPSKFPAMIQKKLESNEVIKVHATKGGEIGTRYYIHSRNTADAIHFILKNVPAYLHVPGEIDRPVRLNIVGDKQLSNLEMVVIISSLMGTQPKYELSYFHDENPGHDLHYGLNGDELYELGWVSPTTFEESMKKTIEWQRAHPEWLK